MSLATLKAIIQYGWKFIAGGIIVGVIAWGLHSLSVMHLKAEHVTDLANQATQLKKECKDEKAITTKHSKILQDNLADLKRKYDANRLRPSTCVNVIARPATGRDGATAGNKPVR